MEEGGRMMEGCRLDGRQCETHSMKIIHISRQKPQRHKGLRIPFKVEVSLLSIICLPIYPPTSLHTYDMSPEIFCLDEFCYVN